MISYYGGMFGEFICTQLSKDQNFYSVEPEVTDSNRYLYGNPFLKYGLNLKLFDSEKTNIDTASLDNDFSEKNLCFPSHIFQKDMSYLNIPRVKFVRIYSSDRDILLLGYIMGWIKSLVSTNNLSEWTQEFERYIDNKESVEYYNLIKQRGYFYWFEKLSMKHKVYNIKEFIDYWWDCYKKYNDKRWDQWEYIDVGKLFLDYKNSKDYWKEFFDLDSYLDNNDLQGYYFKNLEIFKEEFNMSFEDFKIKNNWNELLYNWVKLKIKKAA